MKNKQLLVVWCFVFLFVLVVAGCQKTGPDGRLPVSGTVSVNGTPIESGAISFEPLGTPAIKTPSGGAILDGKYAVPMAQGLVPGEYVVRIYGYKEAGVDESHPLKPLIRDPIVPDKYGTFSELKATVAAGETKFDFDLKVEEADFKK